MDTFVFETSTEITSYEFARISANGEVTFKWKVIKELVYEYDVDNNHGRAQCYAKLIDAAYKRGVLHSSQGTYTEYEEP